jgi:4-hydroxy-2-oxoglutarate aldolase
MNKILVSFWCNPYEDGQDYRPIGTIVDIPPLKKHVLCLAKAGIRPLLAGTMGEGLHLSHSERVSLIKATREALDDAGYHDMPIIAGTGAGSTRETIQLSKEAAEAGADYVIVITPGYFASALATNRTALKDFFIEVAEKSPIPVIIYNCGYIVNGHEPNQSPHDLFTVPGVSGGIDLDSDIIIEIAKEAPNIIGVKLTYDPCIVLNCSMIDPFRVVGVEISESRQGSVRYYLHPPLLQNSLGNLMQMFPSLH